MYKLIATVLIEHGVTRVIIIIIYRVSCKMSI